MTEESKDWIDAKRLIRRQQAYLLWMAGETNLSVIAEKLEVSTRTIKRDLAEVTIELSEQGVDYGPIRKEAMQSLRTTKRLILAELSNADPGGHVRSNLLKTLGQIDVSIAARIAQPPSAGRKLSIKILREEAKIVADFVTQLHPELLDEFGDYIKTKKKERALEAKGSQTTTAITSSGPAM